jgi:HK97 family phage major capsid protein/HK97 family phage prohead protease
MDTKNISFNDLECEETGVIAGYASVFNIVDQHNDLIKPGAFKGFSKDKIKFLWQHKADEPIGVIEEIIEDKHGLYFKAKLLLDLPQAKYAYNLIKAKAISGVSIGFQSEKTHQSGEVRVIESVDLWEISLVTFPANKLANITEIKQYKQGKAMQKNTEKLKSWEEFKSINDKIEKSIEQKGSSDPLLSQQLIRISDHLDEYKSRLDTLETAASRPFSGSNVSSSYSDNEHKSAFNSYLKSGNEQNLCKIEQKSLSAGSDADGGYLITRETSNEITRILEEISPMRQLASREMISTGSLDIIEDYNSAGAGWTSETKAVMDTDTPKINKRNIPVFELFAQPSATQKLIDDSSVDIERWLSEKLVNSFAKLENKAFINGDGSSCPRGILTYLDGLEWGKIQQVKSKNEGSFCADSLFNLYFSLKEQYCNNASFLMNRFTLHTVRTLKDKNSGRYLWTPGISEKNPNTLLGLPVYEAADMPVIEKGSLSVALADFKSAYKIIDRLGVRVLRDPYTFKPFVKFYSTKRVGGDVINFEALKLLKLSA